MKRATVVNDVDAEFRTGYSEQNTEIILNRRKPMDTRSILISTLKMYYVAAVVVTLAFAAFAYMASGKEGVYLYGFPIFFAAIGFVWLMTALKTFLTVRSIRAVARESEPPVAAR
jgi:hypothetical protein